MPTRSRLSHSAFLLGLLASPVLAQTSPPDQTAWPKALAATIASAKVSAQKAPAEPAAQRIVDALRSLEPSLLEQQRPSLADWIPEVYARFGQTNHALASIAPGKDASAIRVLLVSFDANLAAKNPSAAKDAIARLEALLPQSAGTLSAPGLYEAAIKARARLGDATSILAIAKLAATAGIKDRETDALRVTAIRVLLGERNIDAAAKIAAEVVDPLARYDTYAAIGQAREAGGDLKSAARDYTLALNSLASDRTGKSPSQSPALVATAIYRCAPVTTTADKYVSEFVTWASETDPLLMRETKHTMLAAAGDAAARLRIAAAFRDTLLVGEEALRLGKNTDAAKILKDWLAGEPLIRTPVDVLGAVAQEEAPSATGVPGRIDRLLRAGRALAEAGASTEAATAFRRAADALEIIKPRTLRPDAIAEVAAAQAKANLKEASQASFAKAMEWARSIKDEPTRAEMLARIALWQVEAGDVAAAETSAGQIPASGAASFIADVWPAIAVAHTRAAHRAQAEAAWKKSLASVNEAMRPIAAAAVVKARLSLGEITDATAMLSANPTAPVPPDTLATLIAIHAKAGRTPDAKLCLTAGTEERSPALAERLKLAAKRLSDARQHRAAIETLALLPREAPPETIVAVYVAAAESGQGEYLASKIRGKELSLGERAAAVALFKKGDKTNAAALLRKLVDLHMSETDLSIKLPALVADGMTHVALEDNQTATRLGREVFQRTAKLWLEVEWKDRWVPETLSGAATLRVTAGDIDQVLADVAKIDAAVRSDLASVVATALVGGTGPLAAIR